MNMQTPATAPSNRFVKLSILHRDKGKKSPGVPKLKNRTVKSQHYLNYQISMAMQIPHVKAELGDRKGKKQNTSRARKIFVSKTGGLASEEQLHRGEVILMRMVTPQPFNYFN